jgi:hypothetical protein
MKNLKQKNLKQKKILNFLERVQTLSMYWKRMVTSGLKCFLFRNIIFFYFKKIIFDINTSK